MARQSIGFGASGPVYLNETVTLQTISVAAVYVNETIASSTAAITFFGFSQWDIQPLLMKVVGY